MENRPSDGPTAPTTPAEKASVFEDFIDIFHAPASVFARREKSGFGMQLLIVTVLCALFVFANRGLMSQIFDAEFQRGAAKAMAANPQVTADQMNSMRGIQEKVFGIVQYVTPPLIVFFTAFFVWLAGLVLKTKVTFGQAALIVTLAFIPRLLSFLATTLQVLLMDTSRITSPGAISLSPARFMDPDTSNAKLYAFLGNFDIFAIWYAVVIGIGIAVIAKVPRSKGYVTSAVVFILLSLPALMR